MGRGFNRAALLSEKGEPKLNEEYHQASRQSLLRKVIKEVKN